MATVQTLINDALRHLGVYASGESPSSDESTDCLRALNLLIASWVAEKLPLFAIKRELFALSGAGSYTIGTGAAFNTTRPHKIRAISVLLANGTERNAEIVGADRWANDPLIGDKTASGLEAKFAYYDGNYPTATIYLQPKPTAGQIVLYHYQTIAAFATTGDTVDFPPGYEAAIGFNLAVHVAPQFARPVSQELMLNAQSTKAAIVTLNAQVLGEALPGQAPPGPPQ